MEARIIRAIALLAVAVSLGAGYRTPNFIVQAPTPEMAEQIGTMAEKFRRELAIEWLGKPMPNWSQPCPIEAQVAPNLGAGGATSFVFDRGEVFGWQMTIQGPSDRIIDSVLPHEVTHTIFATHFRQPLPRWADEGACTTVEHASERMKQQKMLIQFLQTGRGIAFSKMFAMREYPRDVMPLYSQGFSLARFLIHQGGKRKYIEYIGAGLKSGDWIATTESHYGYENLANLQDSWLAWVRQGSPEHVRGVTPAQVASTSDTILRQRDEDLTFRGQSPDQQASEASLDLPVPVRVQETSASAPDSDWRSPAGQAPTGPASIYQQGPRGANVPPATQTAPAARPATTARPVDRPRVLLEWDSAAGK